MVGAEALCLRSGVKASRTVDGEVLPCRRQVLLWKDLANGYVSERGN